MEEESELFKRKKLHIQVYYLKKENELYKRMFHSIFSAIGQFFEEKDFLDEQLSKDLKCIENWKLPD